MLDPMAKYQSNGLRSRKRVAAGNQLQIKEVLIQQVAQKKANL